MVVYPEGVFAVALSWKVFIQLFNFKLLSRNPFGVAVGFVKLDGISVVARDLHAMLIQGRFCRVELGLLCHRMRVCWRRAIFLNFFHPGLSEAMLLHIEGRK
jgi:hypothetical protein